MLWNEQRTVCSMKAILAVADEAKTIDCASNKTYAGGKKARNIQIVNSSQTHCFHEYVQQVWLVLQNMIKAHSITNARDLQKIPPKPDKSFTSYASKGKNNDLYCK